MKRLTWIGLVVSLALSGCARPADQASAPAATAAAVADRPGPVRWNPTSGAFELNGKPMKAAKLWTFDGSTDGFTSASSPIAPAPDRGLSVKILDPSLSSPKGLNVPGAQYPLVLVRLTRTAAGSVWDSALYYGTAAHPSSIAFFGKPLFGAKPAVGETTTMVYNMAAQANGAPDWQQSIVDQIRLDLEDKPGGAFIVRQIAITDDPDPQALALAATPPASKKPKS